MSIDPARIKAFKQKLNKAKDNLVPEIAKAAQENIAKRVYGSVKWYNPVLTGHSRHNWIATINEQWRQEIEGVYAEDGETHDPLTGLELAHWASLRRRFMAQPLGQTIWICNNAPYIERLEHGYSQKAPQGMVRVTLQALLEDVLSRGVRNDVGNE